MFEPDRQDLTCYAGATWREHLEWRAGDRPVDLTGCAALFQIRDILGDVMRVVWLAFVLDLAMSFPPVAPGGWASRRGPHARGRCGGL